MAKTALVTGSTSGIGQAIAESLAAAGMNVVLNGFGDAAEIEALRKRIADDNGVNVTYSDADMTKPDEIAAMVDQAVRDHGSIDVLVNNAGIQHVSPIEDFPVDMWDKVMAINLNHAFHTIRAAVPHMKKNGWGRIINLGSIHAVIASPYKAAYVAAKHGMAGLTKTVALEVAQDGITCNIVCPSYVRTPLVDKQIPATAKSRGITEEQVINEVMLGPVPTKRFVGLDELGGFVAFLASDAAASITGSVLPIDGGWTAH